MSDEMPHYSIVIEWSADDQAYFVTLPELADRYAMPVATSGERQNV
ncbi:MAG: hypothetical protein ACXWQR_05040 [Ktedonobacterales bacterium]